MEALIRCPHPTASDSSSSNTESLPEGDFPCADKPAVILFNILISILLGSLPLFPFTPSTFTSPDQDKSC